MNGWARAWIWLLVCFIGAVWQPVQAQSVVRYYVTDALGSVVVVTDESGNVMERREYEPYGAQLTPAVQDGPGYTGHVQDAATGLVYMQQRYYDPTIGRFLSTDPVAASANTGANFNRYKYAANNPYKFTDPDGRYECQGSARSCAVVDRAVAAVNGALSNMEPGTSEHSKLSAVSQALGQKGDKGITFKPEALKGRVFARAGENGLIRIDTGKIERGLDSYNAANPHMQSGQVSDALGGRAVTHETQHQIDYKKPGMGYPTNRDAAMLIERSAYTSQAAFDQAAGLNSDLWNPSMSSELRAQKIEDAANRSVNDVWSNR